MFSIKINHNPT